MKKIPILPNYVRVFVLLVSGVIFFILPEFLPLLSQKYAGLIVTFGSLLIGSSLIDALFQLRFQKQIEEQVDTLRTNISTLQDTVMIAKGAVEAGLTAVYATREECLRQIKAKLEPILQNINNNKQKEGVNISILGISLGDFLCPHGFLQPTFRQILKEKGFNIRVAILSDGCNAAFHRAIREEFGKFQTVIKGRKDYTGVESDDNIHAIYDSTKCHDELKTATDYLRDLICRHEIDRDEPANDKKVEASLKAFVYKGHPMAFMFVIDDDMFIENYHLAGRGGEAPILQVARYKKQSREESKLYKIFMGHYESVIQMSEELECHCNDEQRRAQRHLHEEKQIANKTTEATQRSVPNTPEIR